MSAAEARFLSQKLPEGRDGGSEGKGRKAIKNRRRDGSFGIGGREWRQRARQAKGKGSTLELWPITQARG